MDLFCFLTYKDDIIQPHVDIRRGHFDEAVFAADLGDVYRGNAPQDYNDPYIFFKKTYLTMGLTRVHEKLRDEVGSALDAANHLINGSTSDNDGKSIRLYDVLMDFSERSGKDKKKVTVTAPRTRRVRGEASDGHLV